MDVVIDTILADAGATGVLMHIGDEDNVRAIMRHPRHSGGSDGILIGARPHPRGRGTFPRYLGHYVRDLGVLSLEEAVHHLSGNPAARLGLDRGDAPRGVLREGATADLVLFDPETIAAGATFDDPHGAPQGVREVLVGGVPVVIDGDPTGAVAGRALRMPPRRRARRCRTSSQRSTPGSGLPMDPVDADRGGTGAGRGRRTTRRRGADDTLPAIRLVIDPELGAAASAAGRHGPEAFRVTATASGIEIAGRRRRGSSAARPRSVSSATRTTTPLSPRRSRQGWEGSPAYAWRGAMLDVARHFRPAEDVRRLIDLLADHHLSILHLHLTDDQGWRFEVPGYPRLTEVGARREATQRGHGPEATVEPGVHEGFYTTAELRDLVRYAAERFVTLVPEVELPGHIRPRSPRTRSWATSTSGRRPPGRGSVSA